MRLKTCMLTQNATYQLQRPINLKGIVVHSTGCNQRYLKRWVQPSENDEEAYEILADLGKNQYNNSWNDPKQTTIVHYMIGWNLAGETEVYQTLEDNVCCGGVYKGVNGSFNDSHIQFEMLEDDHKDDVYFKDIVNNAIELCAYLCEKYDLPVESIVSHKECGEMGYGSKHGDPENWFKDFGYTMNDFRAAVDAKLHPVVVFKKGDKVGIKEGVTTYYNGATIAEFVRDGRPLWVMSSDKDKTLITVDETLSAGTGWMRTKDLYLCENQGTITFLAIEEEEMVLKSEYDKVVAEKKELQIAYDNLCKSYDELAEDYDKVRKDHDTLWETTLDYKRTIDKIREIVQ